MLKCLTNFVQVKICISKHRVPRDLRSYRIKLENTEVGSDNLSPTQHCYFRSSILFGADITVYLTTMDYNKKDLIKLAPIITVIE